MLKTFDTAVFSEPQGEAAARVYVVAASTEDAASDELTPLRLSGHIVGPTCRYSSTLQAKIPFAHRGLTQWGDRPALLAEATIPDPCYWSTDTPFLYRAIGEIVGTKNGPTPLDQSFGIRSVGVHRKRLLLNGKPWVPRIIRRTMVGLQTSPAAWRESQSMASVFPGDRQWCADASLAGVCVAPFLHNRPEVIAEQLADLGTEPSVALAFIDPWEPPPPSIRTVARNTLLCYCSVNRNTAATPPDWADLVAIDADDEDGGAEAVRLSPLPVILSRMLPGELPLLAARKACDQLQSEFAGKCDVAGYWVYEEIE